MRVLLAGAKMSQRRVFQFVAVVDEFVFIAPILVGNLRRAKDVVAPREREFNAAEAQKD